MQRAHSTHARGTLYSLRTAPPGSDRSVTPSLYFSLKAAWSESLETPMTSAPALANTGSSAVNCGVRQALAVMESGRK
jgi:hypothetical protein